MYRYKVMGQQRNLHPCPPLQPSPEKPTTPQGGERWSEIGPDGDILHDNYLPDFYSTKCDRFRFEFPQEENPFKNRKSI